MLVYANLGTIVPNTRLYCLIIIYTLFSILIRNVDINTTTSHNAGQVVTKVMKAIMSVTVKHVYLCRTSRYRNVGLR